MYRYTTCISIFVMLKHSLLIQLDVSGDRVPDCIVRGGNTMLFMIEARFGTVVWHLHEHKEGKF